ncbi:MAG: TonB-dependent receptor [Candidatus Acidiferrales bacterium]
MPARRLTGAPEDRKAFGAKHVSCTMGRGNLSRKIASSMKTLLAILLFAGSLYGQSNTGELRLKVTDPSGSAVKTPVEIVSEASQYRESFETDESGRIVAKRLPFGLYQVHIQAPGFAPYLETIEVRSTLPGERTIQLKVAAVDATVNVTSQDTLVDPDRPGAVSQLGPDFLENRPSSLPGRSLQDLVNSQPGWLYEGNAVLHPRGAEYQTQFVLDGIPLTDNRSPGFGTEIEADDVDSMTIYTAGFPAEYGRKMGGVVEINTLQDAQPGLHGQLVQSGGSSDTAAAFTKIEYRWGKNHIGVSASGDETSHYLNPVVPQNFTNTGTTGDFSAIYERDFTPKDQLTMSVRHSLARYEIPNEQLQQANGQVQTADNFETIGTISYSHIFSSNVVGELHGMVRDSSSNLDSNPFSTPIIAFQHNWFREGYFKGAISIHHGNQEWKVGVESDAMFLHENFSDVITNPIYFDPGTPDTFSFAGNRPDLEQSAFIQDMIRLGKWTISAGLRWDHYQLIANQNAVSPRLSIARYFQSADLVLHASYDRIFQTPSFENILLSSSPTVVVLNPDVLRLPVQPSRGDFYEAGMSKGFLGQLRLDANIYRRFARDYADDDQLLNTGVSFPISFDKAIIYGAEGKFEIPHWGNLSGFLSYSYMVGNAWFPVTGGLFLGVDATTAATQLTGHFPDSQDQRNTLRTRFRYQVLPRLWLAGGAEYGSGLPFDFDGAYAQALAQYGQAVVDRINFNRGRVKPSLAINASIGADVYKSERMTMRFQADGQNLNNRLNVIDFGGLFSGNAIAPSRSFFFRFSTSF